MKRYRIGFVLEQVLGHVTHSLNIQRIAAMDRVLEPAWLPVTYEMSPWETRLPVYNHNWTVRAGWKVRRSLRRMAAKSALDGLFIHTQVLGVLVPDWIKRYPTVISLDATPLQYDQLGRGYSHAKSSPRTEAIKFWLNRRMFIQASHLVTWTRWAKDSLVEDYRIPAAKITVIPPGVDLQRFSSVSKEPRGIQGRPVKILFVGGDSKRKGGYLLLEAFRSLRETYPKDSVELHLVTHSDVAQEPGIFVYKDIHPGDERLIQQFASADIFALPTEGDCLPMVLAEAGASALPTVSTSLAGIPEIVLEADTGFLIEPGDGKALVDALARLLDDPDLRLRMGARAQQFVSQQHDAARNVPRLLELIKDQVDARGQIHAGDRSRSMRQA